MFSVYRAIVYIYQISLVWDTFDIIASQIIVTQLCKYVNGGNLRSNVCVCVCVCMCVYVCK